MRKILKDTCILAALMILIIFSFSIAEAGFTDEIKLVFEIFGLALILSVFNYFFDEKTSFSMIVSYLIKYIAVSVMVIFFGFITGWFYPSNYWMAFIYVGVITVIIFALDSVKTEKELEEINDMVRKNNNEKTEVRPLKRRRGWKVILVLLLSMIVLFSASLIGYGLVSKYNSDLRAQHKKEAAEAGYETIYRPCERLDDVVIDGVLYESYHSYKLYFAGTVEGHDVTLYVEKGSDYIDGTEDEKERLTIYCTDIRAGSYEYYIEPYSIYNSGKQILEDYCVYGLVISGIAVVVLTILLSGYMIIHHIRSRKLLSQQ